MGTEVQTWNNTNGSAVPLEGRCNALKKNGMYCKNRLGNRTTHVGEGRCSIHGGSVPILHGRYSGLERTRITDLYQMFKDDEDFLDVRDEIAMGRALLADFLNRYAAFSSALLAWHESYVGKPIGLDRVEEITRVLDEYERLSNESAAERTEAEQAALEGARETCDRLMNGSLNKPRQILDVATAHQLLDSITNMVAKVEKIRAANAISVKDFLRVTRQMAATVDAIWGTTDPAGIEKCKLAWAAIAVR